MADGELTKDAVRDFMVAAEGKCTNQELVTFFKSFLNDPVNKAKNRERFKDIVNTLSSVKVNENGQKYLTLKKQYRTSKNLGSRNSLYESQGPATTAVSALGSAASISSCESNLQIDSTPRQNQRAKSEPPCVQPQSDTTEVVIQEPPAPADDAFSKCKSESNLRSPKASAFRDSNSTISTCSIASTASEEEVVDAPSAITSVKDHAKYLNKIQSECDLLKVTYRKVDKSKFEKGKEGTDNDDDGQSSTFVTLTTEQHEWMMIAAKCDYQDLNRLLSKNQSLAKERSFINTALHWAAKHGKPDVVKLLCGKPGVNVDQKTGFTPLHLASIHCHDDVIELLVRTYKANPNLRDHSGKKPKQYLSGSVSARCQQLLQTRIGKSPDENFERSEAIRKSKRIAVVGNLINSSNIMKAQPIMRSGWGGSCEDLQHLSSTYSSRSTSPSSSLEGSPPLSRKSSGATSLMLPPTAPVRKKKQRSKTMYASKENLDFDFQNLTFRRNDSDNSLEDSSYA